MSKILIIEDEEAIADLEKDYLGKDGKKSDAISCDARNFMHGQKNGSPSTNLRTPVCG